MKKTLAFLLALVMMLAAVPAMAAAPTLDLYFSEAPIDVPLEGREYILDIIYDGSTYDIYYFWPDENGELQYDNSATNQSDGNSWWFEPLGNEAEWSREKWESVGIQPWVAYMSGDFGKVAVEWYSTYIEIDGEPYVRLSVNPWEVDENGNLVEIELEEGDRFLDENKDEMEDIIDNGGKEDENPDDEEEEDEEPVAPAPIWYPGNTMGLVGLPLRDTFPGLTSKWYHVVPVDLTVEGTTTIPMVASNLFLISNAHVTVEGDNVTVTYDGLSPHGYGWVNDECVAWFTSVDQITTEWLNAPESDLEFGQTISRANDLGNAEIALLFVCNNVTYRQPYFTNDAFLPRYWPNLAQWKAYRADLTVLLDQMTAPAVASPAAEAVAE